MGADASIVVPPASPKVASKTRKRPAYPEAFEAAWKAYPHHEGRSSKPATFAEWERLPAPEAEALLGCIERFRPNVERVCGGKGAPCMSRWLKDGKHLNWMPYEAPEPVVSEWRGPAKVVDILAQGFDRSKAEGYAAAYCTWQDVPYEALVVSQEAMAKLIRKSRAGPIFQAEGIAILVQGRAA